MEQFTMQDLDKALRELNIGEVPMYATKDFWNEFDNACVEDVKQQQNKND